MTSSQLTALQRELLEAFFERERRFFLTGGAALGGFYLGHRPSEDLDLFALAPTSLEDAEVALADAAASLGATIRSLRRFPDFRRFLVERRDEKTVVDLVVDRAPQIEIEKPTIGRIRIDSLREIAANKLCTLLSRCEPKDLVDLKAVLESGGDLEQALKDAEAKDAGASAANLAFVLGQWRIGSGAALPGGVDPDAAERFREQLVARLVDLAFPRRGDPD